MLRSLVIGVAALAALLVAIAVVARFSDGPLGPFPGGKLSGGRVSEAVEDWKPILAGATHLELEVDPDHPRSMTTSYIVYDGALYVPSMFAARKRWPKQVLEDGRVVVRIGDKLYERRAVRVTDANELRPLVQTHDPNAVDVDPDTLSTWYFRLDPRTP